MLGKKKITFNLLALFLLLEQGIFCKELRIENANELISFSNDVNNGKKYTGTTVFLDSDIVFTDELSQTFDPIGKASPNYFAGFFNGQGYVISNLVINSDSRYTGLFGYLNEASIKMLYWIRPALSKVLILQLLRPMLGELMRIANHVPENVSSTIM